MHAILGFAASELIPTDPSLVAASMNHRIKAIRAIKRRLADSNRIATNYEEANALIATCYALTFQSVSLEDGLAEYMTFIRGIVIVAMQMMFRGIKPIFANMGGEDQDAIMAPLLENLPLIQKGWADAALEAITNLGPLCTDPVEIGYHEKLMAIVEKLYVSSFAGMLFLRHPETHVFLLRPLTNLRRSLQSQLESIWMVDDAPPSAILASFGPEQSSGRSFTFALDCTFTNHGFHIPTGI